MYPDPSERIPVERIMLERTKVGARYSLGPQMAHDLKLDISEIDRISQSMILNLRSYLYKQNLGDETQTVRVAKRVPYDTKERKAIFGMIGWSLFAVATILAFSNALNWAFGAVIIAFFVMAFGVASSPENVAIDEEVEVNATYWHKYPDNTYIFPEKLGVPVLEVVKHPPVLVDSDEKRV